MENENINSIKNTGEETTPTDLDKTTPFKGSSKLFILGIASCLGYIYLFLLSGEGLKPGQTNPEYLTRFLCTIGFLFLCYWVLISPLIRGKSMNPRHLWFAIAFSLLFRAIMLPSDLILENDIYRYMWDGHMNANGVNPYRFAPADPALDRYSTDYRDQINYAYIPTIYPPTLQYVFLVSELLYPGSVFGMKFILLIFDIGTIFLLLSLLDSLKKPREWVLIYAWSPLVIKEIANSGHADSVSAFLLVGCLWLIAQERMGWSSVGMALLTLTKFFSILLVPLFHRIWKWIHFLLFLFILLLLYVPFFDFNVNVLKGFWTYSQEWQFNAGIFTIADHLVRQLDLDYEQAGLLTRLILATIVLTVTMGQVIVVNWRESKTDLFHAFFILIATVLLCSPVIDPWYLLWIVPLLVLFPNRAWIFFTGLVFLSYTYYYNKTFPAWVKPVEFGLFFLILLWDWVTYNFFRKRASMES